MKASILKAVAVTAELTGTELSEAALRVMAQDLDVYPEAAVLRALDRCRRELKTRLTLAAVLERIEEEDGRPGADEAWAIALGAADEAETVVWTEEIAQAFAVAQPVLEARDKVGARVAFRDAYERLVREARAAAAPCSWVASVGHDPERRAVALRAAIALKRIEAGAVAGLLPQADCGPVIAAVIENKPAALLANPELSASDKAAAARGLAMLKAAMADLDAKAGERAAQAAEEARLRAERDERRRAHLLAQVASLQEAQGVR